MKIGCLTIPYGRKLVSHAVTITVLGILPHWAPAAANLLSKVEIRSEAAGVATLTLDGQELGWAKGGGFRIFDATSEKPVSLNNGVVSLVNGGTSFLAQGEGVRLQATFTPLSDRIVVQGQIENTVGDDRGFIVDYRLATLDPDAKFSGELDEALGLRDGPGREDNVFPLATLNVKGGAIAMAIPPQAPRVFGMVGSSEGLAVRFYLGTSAAPLRFPNRATFEFVIYRADPRWGFRSALERYYAMFPDYYAPRLKKEGLLMFQLADRLPANVSQYAYNLSESQLDPKVLRGAIARDEANGIATIPYMIVGQREMKFLPQLPKNYDEAMAIYNQWTIANHHGHPLVKENVASDGDIHLKEEVDSSAVKTFDGKFSIVVRNTSWGKNSVTFKTNPNPDLFADQQRKTVGSLAIQLQERWYKEHPEYDGVFIDSMGANWPAVLNYRRDHFAYARYPLTFDPWGQVALHNELSHYEYIETMRALMHPRGKVLYANGIYAYNSRGKKERKPGPGVEFQNISAMFQEFLATVAPPEHYRAGTRVGRFFDCALLDLASSEFGIKSTIQQCRDVRVLMGKKPYVFINYYWDDAAKVEEFINRSLSFGIFASNSTNFFTGVEYENHPQGYLRDKPLLDWFVPLVRMLSAAGWQPVRHASVDAVDVTCERFGQGDTVYYALYNNSEKPQACRLELNLRDLGFSPDNIDVSEIARQTSFDRTSTGLVLPLEAKRAYIVRVKRK
jgi:hypothetical protein